MTKTHEDDEEVLVVPAETLDVLGSFQGFMPAKSQYTTTLLHYDTALFMSRSKAEQDVRYKQLIPYCILAHEGRVFSYTRGGGSGESRLRAKKSIGLGGHVSKTDLVDDEALCDETCYAGLRRELREEVGWDPEDSKLMVRGLVNTDASPVGRVHLGLVFMLSLPKGPIELRPETAMESGYFAPISELVADIDSYEEWSQLCIRGIWPAVVRDTQPLP